MRGLLKELNEIYTKFYNSIKIKEKIFHSTASKIEKKK